MTNAVTPHNTLQSIAASMSSAAVQTNSQVNVPGTTNQTLLSLLSTGQISMQGFETSTPAILPAGLGSAPIPPGGQQVPNQNPTWNGVALNGQYGGT